MDKPEKESFDLFGVLKSWIPWRSEPANVSRDFWMPNNSCRVCYECDAQFNFFIRRHHCRLCGRVFCGKCTSNTVPVPSDGSRNTHEDQDRIRVCNFCFERWKLGLDAVDDEEQDDSYDPAASPSADSFSSFKSSETAFCSTNSLGSLSFSLGHCEQLSENTCLSPYQSVVMDRKGVEGSGRSNNPGAEFDVASLNRFDLVSNRSDDEYDDDYGAHASAPQSRHASQAGKYYGQIEFDEVNNSYEPCNLPLDGEKSDSTGLSSFAFQDSFEPKDRNAVQENSEKEVNQNITEECEAPSSLCAAEDVEMEPVDFENNGLLWLPPEPENEEDEHEALLHDDDTDGDDAGEWGYLHPSGSFGSTEHQGKDKSGEEHKKVMKNVVDGHFRALVSQLLQVENILLDEDSGKESWLEIITSLSWEAASLLKPDTSRGGGMDPGGYVKVKCIASGSRLESMVIKGVVCKKNVAHRRMRTRIEKPRVMALGGALEYQRVTNHLSSFDTLLQQEMDHLKMAVAKIDAHHPNILLVEKSVSRHAQEYLLEKDISLVLNLKRPLLDRIARCTGAQVVPSVDHLSSQKMGLCDLFHVEKHLEEHVSGSQCGKRLQKTLMYFEGCPKPLGCTILLRGGNVDELKKVKSVVQYGVFAAYHLGLETSFLADEGASVPELPLKEPITVAPPYKSLSIDRSISTVPSITASDSEKLLPSGVPPIQNTELMKTISLPVDSLPQVAGPALISCGKTAFSSAPVPLEYQNSISSTGLSDAYKHLDESSDGKASVACRAEARTMKHQLLVDFELVQPEEHDMVATNVDNATAATGLGEAPALEHQLMPEDGQRPQDEAISSKEEFPPSPSDHQSILVSLSSRCVWKGTVCERSHLFRIKYYGNFDKPLGRFLQDHLFDQNYRCRSCEMPSEAHVQCYTHRQGTLTISVKKLQEILLPGEREGKIWMWHRCLRCPRTNGFPPATRRVVMSDAAWGLSFGKFLELSFSNHAAASRVASCGHSLHRDCLRFYGSGKMVACFRYASIDVHSVYLPPPKIDFNYEVQDWIWREADEVIKRAEVLFSEVLNGLTQIAEKQTGGSRSSSIKSSESRLHIAGLETILQDEKRQFEEMLQKFLNGEAAKGQPVIDILDLNRLRRQLLFQSYVWDHRLVSAASLDSNSIVASSIVSSSVTEAKTYRIADGASALGVKVGESLNPEGEKHNLPSQSELADRIREASPDLNNLNEDQGSLTCDQSDPLESGVTVRRALSDSEFSFMKNLSDTLDAAWTGKNHLGAGISKDNGFPHLGSFSFDSSLTDVAEKLALENLGEEHCPAKVSLSISPPASTNSAGLDNVEENNNWFGMPFLNFYRLWNKNFLGSGQKLDALGGYNPVYVLSFRELDLYSGARLLLPVGVNETIIPVYHDEPTSIISYALMSPDYYLQLYDEGGRSKEAFESAASLPLHDSLSFRSFHSSEDTLYRSFVSTDEGMLSISSSHSSLGSDPLLHVTVSFSDNSPVDKVKYRVTCYYAKQFDALRKMCCPSELDFVRSLSHCKKWGAQGGKSNVFFAKTLDDRFIIKQVTKTELESFLKFAPEYFKYLTESIQSKSPTCLAKILGTYQVVTKQLKGGKESKMDVLVMENLLFGRKVTRLYDLKGSSRSRYNPDTSGSNKVLLDQNLIEAMPTSPIFVGNKAKRLLERAVWNDTSFLAYVDVMDYSLLVGVDEEKHELVLGIIDFMRQYTWDKHLETWVKASGILGGPKNASPTVISPKQYKKRFRKAMTTYFLMVPDQWSPQNTISTSKSQSDLCEENTQVGASAAEFVLARKEATIKYDI